MAQDSNRRSAGVEHQKQLAACEFGCVYIRVLHP